MIALCIIAIVFGSVALLVSAAIAAHEDGVERGLALAYAAVLAFMIFVLSFALGSAV